MAIAARILTPVIPLVLLAACGGSGEGPHAYSAAEAREITNDIGRLVELGAIGTPTDALILPTGSVGYSGNSFTTLAGYGGAAPGYSGVMIADYDALVNFGTGSASGSMTNFNIVEAMRVTSGNYNVVPVQVLDGTIDLSGSVTGGVATTVHLTGTGTLNSTGPGPYAGSTELTVNTAMLARTITNPADLLYGSFEIAGVGDFSLSGAGGYAWMRPE